MIKCNPGGGGKCKENRGTGEMAQMAKCLSCKSEYQSLILRTHMKKPNMIACW